METKDFEVSIRIFAIDKKIADYDLFQTVAKFLDIQNDLHIIIYHSVKGVKYWNDFYFDGRVMVNETKVCIRLMDEVKIKYFRFFEVWMFFRDLKDN